MRTDQVPRAALLLVTIAFAVAGAGCDDAPPPRPTAPPLPPIPKVIKARTPADFADLCDGKKMTGGAAYKKVPGKASPVVVLSNVADKKHYRIITPTTLKPWKSRKANELQLVACVKAKETKQVKECLFDQKKPVRTLVKFDVTYEISVLEAATGKQLDSRTVETKAGLGCPILHSFSSNRDNYYPRPNSQIIEMLTALQPDDAPAPEVDGRALETACAKQAVRAAAAYDPTSKELSPVKVFARTKEGQSWDHHGGLPYTKAFSEQRRIWDEAVKERSLPKHERYALVACITGKQGAKVRSCAFRGGKSLHMHRATWAVDVIEAKTGKSLGQRTFTGAQGRCPFTHDFNRGDTEMIFPGGPVAAYLKTFSKK